MWYNFNTFWGGSVKSVFINEEDMVVKEKISSGGTGIIYNASYDDLDLALKSFKYKKLIRRSNYSKLVQFCKDFNNIDNRLVTPMYLLGNNLFIHEYLTYLVKGDSFSSLSNLSIEEKIKILRQAKELVFTMHDEYGIVHGDLHLGNFMYDKDDVHIIDFDGCKYDKYDLSMNFCNDISRAFIHKNGVSKDVDNFMFNIITFAFLNECNSHDAVLRMVKKNYGVFDKNNVKDICERLVAYKECNDFLIDSIDDSFYKKSKENLFVRVKNTLSRR